MIKKELLNILACPKCRGALVLADMDSLLKCKDCKQNYPVVDGIPILILEKATSLLTNRKPITESLNISALKEKNKVKATPVSSDLVDQTGSEEDDSIKVLIAKTPEPIQ